MIDKVFDTLIEDIVQELEYTKDKKDTLLIIYDAIKKIVPSNEIHILSVDETDNSFYIIDDNEDISYPLDKGGVLSESYQSHQPLLINDITRSLLYNEEIDNLGKKEVSKILTIPILGYKSSNTILGILWVALFKGYRQFIQQDVDNLIKFINAIKNRIFYTNTPLVEDSSNHRLLECQEAKRVMKVKLGRNENYFASTIHDIRTPMNAVIGFMELMLMGESDEQKREYINATLKSGEQMISLINDVLDMSKVASGQMSINKTDFSPVDVFGDIAKLFYNSMLKNSINFNIYIDPLLPISMKSDMYRIKQIINNLLSNAMKFTPADKDVKLEVRYIKSNETIQISVKDRGIGIAEDRQKSIFNPYTQENNSTASKYGGTGLGLAISQQLSTLLDGTLTLHSTQGEGSEFVLAIPYEGIDSKPYIDVNIFKDINIYFHSQSISYIESNLIKTYLQDIGIKYELWDMKKSQLSGDKDILFIKKDLARKIYDKIQDIINKGTFVIFLKETFDTEDCPFEGIFQNIYAPVLPNILFEKINILLNPNTRSKNQENQLINQKSLKGISVLVIDDSRINLKLMLEILKKFELTVKTAINPKDGLSILEKSRFDVIFIDQNMPIMQGDEAIEIIRRDEQKNGRKPALIYGLTGDEDKQVTEKMISVGADKIFTKPIHIAQVYEAISILKD